MSLTSVLGFVAASVALKTKSPEIYGPPAPPKPPEFRPRWWYSLERLDARPCIWSLQNHPDEWQWTDKRRHEIFHTPSRHQFYVFGMWSRMGRAPCSCGNLEGRGKFHTFQGVAFGRAVAQWDKKEMAKQDVAGHFKEHFVHA